MEKGITVTLAGPAAAEVTRILARRVLEYGRRVEALDEAHVAAFGGSSGADRVCGLLARNGVVVLAHYAGAAPQGEHLAVELDPNDTPDFAAEKVIDDLGAAGVVNLEVIGYSPEDEEQIRQRLADLGYIE